MKYYSYQVFERRIVMKEIENLRNEELNQLSNEELKDNVSEVNKGQLSKVANISYQFLTSEITTIMKAMKNEDFQHEIGKSNEKKMIFENFNYMVNLFKQLNDLELSIDVEQKMTKLMDIRKEYHELSEALYGYEIELSYVKELFDYNIMKKVEKEEYEYLNVDKNEFYILLNKVKEILSDRMIDDFTYIDIISNITGVLPFRMSRPKYYDILRAAIFRNLQDYPVTIVEKQIEDYKKLFNASLHGNYGIIFDNYFSQVQRFKNMPIEDLNLKEFDNIEEDIMDLSMDIGSIRNFIIDIGICLNRLIVILLNKDKLSLSYKEEIHLVLEDSEGQIDEEISNSIIKRCKTELLKIEKELLVDVERLKILNSEIFKREGFFDKDLNKELLFTEQVLIYYNDMEFRGYEILFPGVEEGISDSYIDQLIDSLIHYIDRSIIGMSGIERKIRMRRLLSALELPFQDIEQFLSYIEYSLDERMVSKGEILFAIDTLNYWLDELQEEKV